MAPGSALFTSSHRRRYCANKELPSKKWLMAVGAFLLLTISVVGRENTDILVMNNGDRFTCQVKGLQDGVLYVSIAYVVQTLSVDWSKVANIESKQEFIVKTGDGSVYQGTLKTIEANGSRPMEIEVVEPSEKKELNPKKVIQVAETSDKFWQRFNGSVNSGLTYSRGNENVQYTVGTYAEYLRERWSATAAWNSSLASSTGAPTSTRNQILLSGQRLLPWNNYFYQGIGGFLQSTVQGIDLQTSLGGGIGRDLASTNSATVSALGGFAWQNTQYKQSPVPVNTQNLAAGLIACQVKLFKFNKTARVNDFETGAHEI